MKNQKKVRMNFVKSLKNLYPTNQRIIVQEVTSKMCQNKKSSKSTTSRLIKQVFHPKIDNFEPSPIILIRHHPKELFFNRILALMVAILLCYAEMGVKTNMRDNYDLAPFCGLEDYAYWEGFQEGVESGKNILIKPINCKEKCSGSFPFFFTILFRLDEELLEMTVHLFILYFLGLLNTRVGYLCGYITPPIFRVLVIYLFPTNPYFPVLL